MGIINAGTAVGSVLAPPLIGVILSLSNWRMVFFASGAAGMAWCVVVGELPGKQPGVACIARRAAGR